MSQCLRLNQLWMNLKRAAGSRRLPTRCRNGRSHPRLNQWRAATTRSGIERVYRVRPANDILLPPDDWPCSTPAGPIDPLGPAWPFVRDAAARSSAHVPLLESSQQRSLCVVPFNLYSAFEYSAYAFNSNGSAKLGSLQVALIRTPSALLLLSD